MPSLDEIQAKIDQLLAEKTRILNEQRPSALEEARNLIQIYGFTADELGVSRGAKTQKAPASSKQPKAATTKPDSVLYHNPKDRAMTWSSSNRGQKPKWLRDYLENGGKLENLPTI
ncbi:MAG: H-NS family nucleoid-associated regulatory protein [Thiotrichales bacterium]